MSFLKACSKCGLFYFDKRYTSKCKKCRDKEKIKIVIKPIEEFEETIKEDLWGGG